MFYSTRVVRSQYFPQCVKYLFPAIAGYMLYCDVGDDTGAYHKMSEVIKVKEGFVSVEVTYVRFDVDAPCTPADLETFVAYAPLRGIDTPKTRRLLLMLLKDRWFKGDTDRLKRMLRLDDYTQIVALAENCIWERGYEDYYTLGQQLSIRMTTNLIQSGLDFKHQIANNGEVVMDGSRGWSDPVFVKIFSSIKTVADITKRYKSNNAYVMLELDNANQNEIKDLLSRHFRVVEHDTLNVCLVHCGKSNRGSLAVLERLAPLIKDRRVNVVFVTDSETYVNSHRVFYIYNSMKFYYYCLHNRFVFDYKDYETMYLIFTIVCIEILNGGCLNSFTLEKSPLMNPLELNSRRVNALKRAAAQNKTFNNDMELKIDFIKGKRIKTGTNYCQRLVEIDVKNVPKNE
ncbi:P47 [Betabaculovirus altermyunipunctae]|uniref:P47 n=1 Tax=Betabaculovirus altermyunipunctae TaxID=3051996 RepID=A0A1S5YED4_9BBAC|nr:P47 [Betabaculovirus altermyunipunctae]AQQ80337.1 P47 [Betabaculovirus altermyunipunctae]